MAIKLLEFDTPKELKKILDTAPTKPDSRAKPLHAIMRGMGGGKTRALEELRRECLQNHLNVLPIAVT